MDSQTQDLAGQSIMEIKKLVLRRGQLKATLTRFCSYVNGHNPDIMSLKIRISKLEATWAEFEELQSRLEILDESQESERQFFEEDYFSAVAQASKLIESHDQNSTVNINNSTPSSLCQQHAMFPTNQASNNTTKLQAISLPKFSGSIDKWLQFFEIFQALVHNNAELATIQKFYYLQSCLSGEAMQILQSLEICEANYEKAILLLKERYENKRLLINNHVRNLFDITPILKESHQAFRRLIDHLMCNLRALASLNQPVDQWDTLLIFLVLQKLDNNTKREWEQSNKVESPKFDDFLTFLKNKCQVLETISNSYNLDRQNKVPNKVLAHLELNDSKELSLKSETRRNPQSNTQRCSFCREINHFTYKCSKLLALSFRERYQQLRKIGICTNCLKYGHNSEVCTGRGCRLCNNKHNSVLHDPNFRSNNSSSFVQTTSQSRSFTGNNNNCNVTVTNSDAEMTSSIINQPEGGYDLSVTELSNVAACSHQLVPKVNLTQSPKSQVLLATVVVDVLSSNHVWVQCRALLDAASQSNFCSKELVERLGLKSDKVNIPVLGINKSASNIVARTYSTIKSQNGHFHSKINFLVVDQITADLPQITFDQSCLNIPANIELADPWYNESRPVDILIGAEIFYRTLSSGKLLLGPNLPILQNTNFGWVLAGPISVQPNNHMKNLQCSTSCFLTVNEFSDKEINDVINQFWKIENVDNSLNKLTNEELDCELHFRKNVETDPAGRFIVKLPLKENYTDLGESYSIAKNCLMSLERRLERNPDLKLKYTEFLNEYESLGHMSRIDPHSTNSDGPIVYLSHHSVLRESSTTTKLRVVFNASLKTSTGLSLNDVLKVGPKVQPDIIDIVLRMRTYPILVIADIEKMYRMILVHKSQRDFQRILWRDNQTNEIIHFQLNTITYGTASASFLATRVIHEIGQRVKECNPEVSQIINNCFYMDDLIFGHSDINHLTRLKDEIDSVLQRSGFKLRKWLSNDHKFNENASNVTQESFCFRGENETKALGTVWNPVSDMIGYAFTVNLNTNKITKRTLLSSIGQLYDILGLISPVIVQAKLILQEVWKLQLDWDTEVPETIASKWRDFAEKLEAVNNIRIPRCIGRYNISFLCGFCDASESAYGACIYYVSKNVEDEESFVSNLWCAKSRLAPLSSVSLPRLELCGALLLSQLIQRVILSKDLSSAEIVLFCDSTIVLDWLSSDPSKWKTFVSNRVGEIQRLTNGFTWTHVNSHDNPADIVSRGTSPEQLSQEDIWWHGPAFLKKPRSCWPNNHAVTINIHEARTENVTVSFPLLEKKIDPSEILFKWSSFTKLVRIYSYVFRFINNVKRKVRVTGPLTSNDLNETVLKLCKIIQAERFDSEIHDLKVDRMIHKNSKIISLNPFLDDQGLLRVGGRLENSHLSYARKHQLILPNKHWFISLLIQSYHHKFLHSGPQFILTQIREKFWILNGRHEVRRVLRNCVSCFRAKPVEAQQLMGDLPTNRVAPSRPFACCGVDYAGPYMLKDGKTRNRVLIKSYLCIFICLSTRAVHVELVCDLSSVSFLNAFKRFSSRRGLPSHIFSDNGTNFVGANHELQKLSQLVRDSVSNQYNSYFSEHQITWHFIPARSPHHGGIWESAVRSFKYHLKRVMGENHFNFENFYTLLTQVEAILNSRPITPLSNDPSDLEALTPGHFLIGSNLVSVPQSDETTTPSNRLRHFKQLQQLVQRFWVVWSKDYLNTLQQRSKWRTRQENVRIGTLVLMKEDNEPPMRWPLGRILAVHPGSDDLVRVVSVKTKSGIVRRSITKICPLPIEN